MLNKEELQRIIYNINEKSKQRKIVLYGKSEEIKKQLEQNGISIFMTVTRNTELLKNSTYKCRPLNDIEGKEKEYYVICPFILPDGGKCQKNALESMGYKDGEDYIFYPNLVCNGVHEKYKDEYGNVIVENSCNQINITGRRNRVDIGNDCEVNEMLIHINGNNNKIIIGNHCHFLRKVEFYVSGDDNTIILGNNIKFKGRGKIFAQAHTLLSIGENFTTSDDGFRVLMHRNTKIDIGKDCLFSWNVELQTGDGHPIFDITNEKNINSSFKNASGFASEIQIGEHVWIGHDALILSSKKLTKIGNGSIVGTRSLVKGVFQNNVIIAGIPARTIRKNIAWSRKPYSDDIEDCAGYTDYTVENEM